MANVTKTQKNKKDESLLDKETQLSGAIQTVENKFALGKLNYILIILGVLIVVVGFVLMSGGGSEDPTVFNEEELFHPVRITVAPITVIFGYLVVIFAIMKKPKR